MNASIEISYYPLKEEYIPPIRGFIDRLNDYNDLVVRTNGMSTQVFGEFKQLMQVLTDEICKSFELPHSVFVLKIVNADLNTIE